MSGFRRYFGAQFQHDLVAFENVEYGNAIYVLKGDWAILSKLSRGELLKLNTGVDRIVHFVGWEAKAARIIRQHLGGLSSDQSAA